MYFANTTYFVHDFVLFLSSFIFVSILIAYIVVGYDELLMIKTVRHITIKCNIV